MRVMGADPGLSGALAILDGPPPRLLAAVNLPLRADGSKRQIDVPRLCQLIEGWKPKYAIVENVQPHIGNGFEATGMRPSSAFRFGIGVGQLRATIECYGIKIKPVVPRTWKRHFALPKGANKEMSRQKAIELLPEAAIYLPNRSDHNMAEAILLALWGHDEFGFCD